MTLADNIERIVLNQSTIKYGDKAVLTNQQVSTIFGIKPSTLRSHVSRHSKRFTDGVDYYLVKGAELRDLKRKQPILANYRINRLMLWTSMGVYVLANSLKAPKAKKLVLVDTEPKEVEENTVKLPMATNSPLERLKHKSFYRYNGVTVYMKSQLASYAKVPIAKIQTAINKHRKDMNETVDFYFVEGHDAMSRIKPFSPYPLTTHKAILWTLSGAIRIITQLDDRVSQVANELKEEVKKNMQQGKQSFSQPDVDKIITKEVPNSKVENSIKSSVQDPTSRVADVFGRPSHYSLDMLSVDYNETPTSLMCSLLDNRVLVKTSVGYRVPSMYAGLDIVDTKELIRYAGTNNVGELYDVPFWTTTGRLFIYWLMKQHNMNVLPTLVPLYEQELADYIKERKEQKD